MGNSYHFDNYWEDKRTYECTNCGTTLLLEYCALAEGVHMRKAFYLHYSMSERDATYERAKTVKKIPGKLGDVTPEQFPDLKIKEDRPLVKIVQFEAYKDHYCMACLPKKAVPQVMDAIKDADKAYAISRDYVLNNAV